MAPCMDSVLFSLFQSPMSETVAHRLLSLLPYWSSISSQTTETSGLLEVGVEGESDM